MSLGLTISLMSSTSNGVVGPPAPETIGGIAVGAAGAETFNTGYVMVGGDDFDGPLSVISPANAMGRYSTTRGAYGTTGGGPRGSPGLGGADTDPFWTGSNDEGRGVAPASFADSMIQTGSKLILNSRAATSEEKLLFPDKTKQVVSSMIHTASYLLARAPLVFEWRERRDAGIYSHMTGWMMQGETFITDFDLELDWEADDAQTGDGTRVRANQVVWGGPNPNPLGPTPENPGTVEHTYAIKIDETGTVTWWYDGVLKRTAADATVKALQRAYYLLFTNHIYSSAQAAAAAGGPNVYEILWYRAWVPSTGKLWEPLGSPITVRSAFNASFTATLPTRLVEWGDDTVPEVVEAFMNDANEPGGTITTPYTTPFPNGVSYNTGTRVLSGNVRDKAGRLNVVRYVNKTGDACRPQRIVVEVGPNLSRVPSFSLDVGQVVDFDLYAACDVGVLLPKAITVTGLGGGLSYNSSTGKITGTATAFSGSYTVTCTNSVGQSATVTRSINIATAGAGTQFLNDTFTDTTNTEIALHTGELAASWGANVHPGSQFNAPPRISGTGTLFSSVSAGLISAFYASAVRVSADYRVVGEVEIKTAITGAQVGIAGRADTEVETYYVARYADSAISLLRIVNKTATSLGSFPVSGTAGTTHTIELVMSGSSISVTVNGTPNAISATDTSITGPGRVGLRFFNSGGVPSATTGPHLTRLQAFTL